MCQKTETPCKTRLENEQLRAELKDVRQRLHYCQDKLIPIQHQLLKHLQGEQTLNETINNLISLNR